MKDALLAAAFDALDTPVVVVDRALAIAHANAACRALLDLDDVEGLSWPEIAGRNPALDAQLAGQTTALGPPPRLCTLTRRDHSPVTVVLGLRPLHAGGEFLGHAISLAPPERAGEPMHAVTAAALRRSEDQYRAVVNNASESIVVAQDGVIVFANPRTADTTGYTAQELRGMALAEIVHPDDIGSVLERTRLRALGELDDPYTWFRILRRDGSVRHVQSCPVTIDWEGRPASLAFIADLTEKNRAEEALRTSEERLRVLVNNVSEGIVVAQDGRIVFANPRADEMGGRRTGELLGKLLTDVIHPDDLPMLLERDRRRLEGLPEDRYTVYRTLRGDGSIMWVQSAPVAIAWNGRPASLTFLVDLTERRAAEEALRRSEQRYREVFENVSEGIIVVQDGIVRLCNRALTTITGHPLEAIVDRPMLGFIHPDDQPTVLSNHQARLRGEMPASHYDFRVTGADGRIIWIQLGAVMIEWDGRPATLSFLIDVTQRKHAEIETRIALERQQELNTLKTRFLSMTSHEFRTPLATILSSAELLRYYGDRLPAEETAEMYASIENAVKRMTGLLADVLVIGKHDAGAQRLVTAPVAVADYCRNLVEEVQVAEETLGRPRHAVETEFAGDCGLAHLDESQLRHILVNLLSNAIKYTPAGKAVRLRVEGTPTHLHFEIEDQGIGIADEDMGNLFELFFRARNVGNIGGTGLGLAIVRRAVGLHGGTIEVDSELGTGTRFRVVLPRGEGPHA